MNKWSKIRYAKWFIPILAILAVVLLVGTVFAAIAISNLWTSPTVTVIQGGGGGSPPNSPLIISSPDFNATTYPNGCSIYTEGVVLASVTLNNPSPADAPGYQGVRVALTINKTGIVPGDVVLQYSVDGGINWLPLPLTQGTTDTLVSVFGPTEGFPVPSGYNVTTPLRATFNTAGVYYATAQATQ